MAGRREKRGTDSRAAPVSGISGPLQERNPMYVLITNDDGISAPGLDALVKTALRHGHRVLVSAPSAQQSAVSQHITLNQPLMAHPVSLWEKAEAWAVEGTPADCVRIGLEIADSKPDICVSGINNGENAGSAIYYSGTYGAAKEAAMHHIPAFAVSVMPSADEEMLFSLAERAFRMAESADLSAFPNGTVVNINAPALPPARLKPAVLCAPSMAYYLARYEKRVSPRGTVYYWLQTGLPMEEPEKDSDYDYLRRGHVTVSLLNGLRDINREAAGFLTIATDQDQTEE